MIDITSPQTHVRIGCQKEISVLVTSKMLTLNLCFSFCDVLASVWMCFVPQCECNMFELDTWLFGLGAPTLHAKWGPISMGTGDPVASAS